jgi:HD-like signal output (HDOD) protein
MIPKELVEAESRKGVITPLAVFLQQVHSDPDFPACAENVRALLALAADGDATIQNFAQAIERDLALTLRVLRIANSALYNRSRRPILSVTHAASLLGLDELTRIATSGRLLRHFSGNSSSAIDLTALSLLAANVARRLASAPGGRPSEDAYLAGMLANLGEIAFAYHRPETYARIIAACQGKLRAKQTECRKQIGFNFDEAGAAILHGFGLHGAPHRAIAADADVLKANAAEDPDSRVALAAKLAHVLVAALQRAQDAEQRKILDHWLQAYGGVFGLGLPDLLPLMETAIAEAEEELCHLGIPAHRLRVSSPQVREHLAAMLTEHGHAAEGPCAIALALTAALADHSLDRAIFCEWHPNEDRLVVAAALGLDAASARPLFAPNIALPHRPPLSLALSLRQDLLVDLLSDGRFRETPFVQSLDAALFALLPVVVNGQLAGVLYADRRHPGPTAGLLNALRIVRDSLAHALSLSR